MRAHLRGTGIATLRWLDDAHLLVNGSAVADIMGDLWRLHIDRNGRLVGPPEIWIAGERNTTMDFSDLHGGQILVHRSYVAPRNFVLDHTTHMDLLSSGQSMYPVDLDRLHHRVLVSTNISHTQWAWMSLDGAQVTPLLGFDDLDQIVFAPHGLLAIDARTEPPNLIAFDDRGSERSRIALPMTRDRHPEVRCGPPRCVVRWSGDHDTEVVVIDDDHEGRPTLGRLLRYAERATPRGRGGWDVSPDGNWIAAPKFFTKTIVLYDLKHGTIRQWVCEKCKEVQRVRFTPDGGLLIFGDLGTLPTADRFVLVKRAPDGSEKLLMRSDQWVPIFLPIDDHKILINSISYQSRLSLLEPP
jgi:hypothetical protein